MGTTKKAEVLGLVKELAGWYAITWPMLFARVPIIYFLTNRVGMALWVAILVEFIIERPVFYILATRVIGKKLGNH